MTEQPLSPSSHVVCPSFEVHMSNRPILIEMHVQPLLCSEKQESDPSRIIYNSTRNRNIIIIIIPIPLPTSNQLTYQVYNPE